MADYIKVQLDANGTATLRDRLEKVGKRDAASEFSFGDAQFFQRQASGHWPELDWTTEDLGTGRYLVKADGAKVKVEKPAIKGRER